MPIEYRIDPSHFWVRINVVGPTADDELLAVAKQILDDPMFPSAPRISCDSRKRENVASFRMVLETQSLLRQCKTSLRDARCAMIASNPASFGMQRVFAARAESVSFEARAFADEEQATRWLLEGDSREIDRVP